MTRLFFLLAIIVAAFNATAEAAEDEFHLLPLPMRIERTDGNVAMPALVQTKFVQISDSSLGQDGYILETNAGQITISANTAAGNYYGRQTLNQLLNSDAHAMPSVRITDRPRFPYRGMLLDSSRHIQSVEYLKRTIDLFAHYKINRLHWHLTDDVGWRIELKKYPRLTEIGAYRGTGDKRYGGFYTEAQLRDLVAYAKERFVTIIPEIEMPGHAQALVAAYPEIGCTGQPVSVLEEFKLSDHPLCPSNPKTYEIVDGILDEVMDVFPSEFIHVGGDECPRSPWKLCPRCQAFIKEHSLKDEDGLQAYFTAQIAAHIRSKGRRLMGWSEIMHGGDPGRETVVQQWLDAPAGAAAAVAGHDVVVSQYESLYFDYSYTTTPLKKVYDFDPMPPGLSIEQSTRILGPEACLWTENFPTEQAMDHQIWPRMLAVAEMGWSPQPLRSWDNFSRRLSTMEYQRLAKSLANETPASAAVIQQQLSEHGAIGAPVPTSHPSR